MVNTRTSRLQHSGLPVRLRWRATDSCTIVSRAYSDRALHDRILCLRLGAPLAGDDNNDQNYERTSLIELDHLQYLIFS